MTHTCSAKAYRYPCNQLISWPFGLLHASTRNPLHVIPLANPHGDLDGPTMGFLGDVMPSWGGRRPVVCDSVRRLLGRFDKVACNLEAPVLSDTAYTRPAKGLKLAFSRDQANRMLDAIGTASERTYVSLGNNHVNDYGVEEFGHTVGFLRGRGHPVVGVSDSALGIEEVSLGDVRFGLVGWTYWLNKVWRGSCLQLRPTVRTDVLGVDFGDIKRRHNLDFLVLFAHWSYEFKHFPRRRVQEIATSLVNAGADIIVGHHPHVVSPLVRMGAGYVHYSLGNFSGLHPRWHTRLGCVMSLAARRGSNGGIRYGFENTPVYQLKRSGTERVSTLDELGQRLRRRCEKRFQLVHPSSTGVNSLTPGRLPKMVAE